MSSSSSSSSAPWWWWPFSGLGTRIINFISPPTITLSPRLELSAEDDDILMFGNVPPMAVVSRDKFLDRWSVDDVLKIITNFKMVHNKIGQPVLDYFATKGYRNLRVEIDTSDGFVHKLQIFAEAFDPLRPSFHLDPPPSSSRHSTDLSPPSISNSSSPSGTSSPQVNNGSTVSSSSSSMSNCCVSSSSPRAGAGKSELLVQLFVRKETNFSVFETKCWNNDAGKLPLFYAHGFEEGAAFMRSALGHYSVNRASPTAPINSNTKLQVTFIEWLRMQDPRAPFGNAMPLPGQVHPGLGVSNEIDAILKDAGNKNHRDAIVNTPEHWYNASLYSRASPPHCFLNPAFQGFFLGMCKALEPEIKERGFSAVAWAVFRGMVYCKVNEQDPAVPVHWVSLEQACPLSKRMADYFHSDGYKKLVRKFFHPEHFSVMAEPPERSKTPRTPKSPLQLSTLLTPSTLVQLTEGKTPPPPINLQASSSTPAINPLP